MKRLALTTLTACLLAGPVLAAPGPVEQPEATKAATPATTVAACPGKHTPTT